MHRAAQVKPPAFDNAALAAARQRARATWAEESAKERDRLLALPVAERLAALDDDEVRAMLMPSHRAELRASITAGSAQPVQAPEDEDHAAAMAAWRARDATAQAERQRQERDRRGRLVLSVLLVVMVAALLVMQILR
jgi:hypothetical protein